LLLETIKPPIQEFKFNAHLGAILSALSSAVQPSTAILLTQAKTIITVHSPHHQVYDHVFSFEGDQQFTKIHCTEHQKPPSTHTQEQTQYRRSTVKEHDHHWDSQQDFNELKICINFNKSVLTILSPSITHTCEAFSLKCWTPSDDGHYWPKHIKA
jgi:hypothetical protein